MPRRPTIREKKNNLSRQTTQSGQKSKKEL
jgi:hypothetical protein